MTTTNQIARAEALVNRIEAETKAEAERIVAKAEAEARALEKNARKRARQRISQQIDLLRRARNDARQREEARLDTQRRLLKQREASAIIDAGLPALADALNALWADAKTREGWIMALVARAEGQFGAGKWRVEHAGDLTLTETEKLSEAIERASGQKPDFREDKEIKAGLRLCAGSAVLDGSHAALMANRKETGAALLATLGESGPNRGNVV